MLKTIRRFIDAHIQRSQARVRYCEQERKSGTPHA